MTDRRIEYWILRSGLGELLVAGTDRGVCFVRLDETRGALRAHLEAEFPYGAFRRCADGAVRRWCEAIARYVDGRSDVLDVPIDVRGSRFQRRVWNALRRIPRGETRSYSEVAATLGRPRAARAVARACATNPAPVVIPCHRVIGKNGGLAGYALGTDRKRALLQREGARLCEGRRPGVPAAVAERPPGRYTARPSRRRLAGTSHRAPQGNPHEAQPPP